MTMFREFHLIRRPVGLPSVDDFRIAERPAAPLAEGEVRVRNLFLSVDPYMRGRMSEAKSYATPYDLNAPMSGGAVGRVEESRHPALPIGTLVLSAHGWCDGFVSGAKGLATIDPADGPPQAHLGTLGMPGLTAYVGLTEIGRLAAGETVLVTGAAGAVGSVACQIAKARGCRVIGTAGTDEKAAWLRSQAGVDHAINYRSAGNLRKAFAAAAPDGIDLTFENVGGDHLEAALANAKTFGRVAICGLISQYNATDPGHGLRNVRDILTRRLTVRGFIVSDHGARRDAFLAEMREMIGAGAMRWTETIVDGFERMPEAFLGLFSGANLGKMVVRVGP
ncbi:MAG: NADP-dependent oxidoreductase [Gemmatimonadetes bacterium]|nr:NADP-dependent oxidoreductase [Gemmatimonadota bacterium]